MIFWASFVSVILAMSFLAGVLGVDRTDAAITIAVLVVISVLLRNVLIRMIGDTHIHAD